MEAVCVLKRKPIEHDLLGNMTYVTDPVVMVFRVGRRGRIYLYGLLKKLL